MVTQLLLSALGEGKSMYYKDGTQAQESITIRLSGPGDEEALRRLAGRDSSPLPDGQLLVAAVGEELRAAVPVDGGQAIADPFRPTAELVRMLTARAQQLRASSRGRDGGLGRLLPREAA
jgi:hypothetical protein